MSEENKGVNVGCGGGYGIGSILAALVSFSAFKSIGWAIVAAVFGWTYLVYYVIEYGWPNLQ